MRDAPALQKRQHRGNAVPIALRTARDIDIIRSGVFQRETHKFASALNVRPIVEFISQGSPPSFQVATSISRPAIDGSPGSAAWSPRHRGRSHPRRDLDVLAPSLTDRLNRRIYSS